jgi:hypothetical protein
VAHGITAQGRPLGSRTPKGPLKGDKCEPRRPPRAAAPQGNARTPDRRGLRPRHLPRCLSPRPKGRRPRIPSCLLYLSKDQPGAREKAPAQTQL